MTLRQAQDRVVRAAMQETDEDRRLVAVRSFGGYLRRGPLVIAARLERRLACAALAKLQRRKRG